VKIEIKAFVETSLIDWEGKISSCIFLPYCNLKCCFCQNHPLVVTPEHLKTIPFERVMEYLLKHKEWTDGVVISGGEPTIYPQLPQFIEELKLLGFKIKLDTNGTNPKMLERLINDNLVEYISMDIKAPFPKYPMITSSEVNTNLIKESVQIIRASPKDYEFRTTVVPILLTKSDVGEIAKIIEGAKRYVLQKFIPQNARDHALRTLKPFGREDIEEMIALAKRYVENCDCRGYEWSKPSLPAEATVSSKYKDSDGKIDDPFA
jgi:pyruvate formate lyase activating enzyme